MTTPAEQEAERRYPKVLSPEYGHETSIQAARHYAREGFVKGAEWSESRYQELLEAAREYREAKVALTSLPPRSRKFWDTYEAYKVAMERLLAAAAALEEADEDAG